MSDFLKELRLSGKPLAPEEIDKLVPLGAQTPAELLATIRAEPTAFKRFFGARTTDLTKALQGSSGESGASLVVRRSPRNFKTGALITARKPKLKAPAYDLSERDRLFSELQTLRAQSAPSKAVRQRIKELESRLNSLLESVR